MLLAEVVELVLLLVIVVLLAEMVVLLLVGLVFLCQWSCGPYCCCSCWQS
jgi:hypothetical protein